ncbi:MAG: hypothetical protein ABI806_28875 [Candidatus Solibacter sp.]
MALRFANDLAVELRDLHEESRVYGKLSLHSVSITEAGARLMPLRTYWDQAMPERDIQAFGSIFYQMLHGTPPPATVTASDIRVHASETGPARLRASSTKLALRCVYPKGSRISMQQVATEIRLLAVMQRQEDAGSRPVAEDVFGSAAPPAATPPIDMLIDVPGTVPVPPTAATEQASQHQAAAVPDSESAPPVVQLGPESFGAPKPKPPAIEAPAGGRCPKCDASVVYVSRARSRIELLFERMKIPIVRCHRCYHRYMVIGRIKIPKDMPVGTARKFRPLKRHD